MAAWDGTNERRGETAIMSGLHSRLWYLPVILILTAQMSHADSLSFRLTPPLVWSSGFGASPRIPLAGDANADGFADLLCVYPPDKGIIDLALNGLGEKLLFPTQARTGFGQDCLAAVSGEFAGPKGADVLGIFPDGSIHVAHTLVEGRYTQDEVVATLNPKPSHPLPIAAGDFDGDHKTDVALCTADGALAFLWNEGSARARFRIQTIVSGLKALRLFAGDLDGKGRADLIWQAQNGNIFRAQISAGGLGPFRKIARAAASEPVCVGLFDRDQRADIVIGKRLLPGGDLRQAITLPELAEPKGASILVSGDINGDGRDDIIRYRRTGEKFIGDDVIVYLTYAEGDPDPDSDGLPTEEEKRLGTDPLRRDTDADGLLDGWEVKGAHGLDLPKMGCSPLHKDVLVQAQRWENVDEAAWNKEFEKAVKYYADLPVKNPDGKSGIALHLIPSAPIPKAKAEGRHWGDVGNEFFPKEYRGLGHWMQITPGGGGQAGQMADMGSCGAGYAVFIHEFGHQLGLDHTGYWGVWSPTYTSLMNYVYSYSFDGKGDLIHYSHGELSKLVLRETDLSERLPFPMEKVKFLSGPPYHYRLKASGKETLIDWNWNGILGETHIRADINYAYSTTGGLRQHLDRAYCAPYLVTHGQQLLLFYGQLPFAPGKTPPPDAKNLPPSLCPELPGRLMMRIYQGGQSWSDPLVVEESALAGDPVAVSHKREVWVFYPTPDGVRYRRLWQRSRGWEIGPSQAVVDTKDMQASAVSYNGRLFLFLWSGPKAEVVYRIIDTRGSSPARSAGFTSTFPPGFTVDPVRKHLLIGTGEDQDKDRPSRWQVRRWSRAPKGKLIELEKTWVEGEKGGDRGTQRPTLILQRTPDVGPEGRLHFISGGMASEQSPNTCYYDAMQIADKSIKDGWLTRRYYDEWTQSRSAPAAAWYRGDIVLASRWPGGHPAESNLNLYVGYHGLGIESDPMGDFDDITFIANLGCERSVLYLAAMPSPKKCQ